MIKKSTHFSIDYLQLLSPEGKIDTELPAFAEDKQHLLSLYRTMVTIRLFDKKAIALQRTGKMGTYASILGQEAISTAIGMAMEDKDVLVPYYRDYAAQYLRGTKLSELLLYWGGDERGMCYSEQSSDYPISVPIASQCLHAAGIATALKYQKKPQVVVAMCGDGATSQGDFYEAINVSGTWNLPIVFVVNNNQWAISVPLEEQTGCQTLAQKAIAAGLTGVQVDGNDVLAMQSVVGAAIEQARTHHQPTIIEAMSYRLCDHTTADDAARYRPEGQLEEAWKNEPILRLEKYLVAKELLSDVEKKDIEKQAKDIIEMAVNDYLQTPLQPIDSLFDYMYETCPEDLEKQKQFAIEEAKHV